MDSLRPEHEGVEAVDTGPADAREVILGAVRALAEIFHGNEDLLRAFMHLGAVDDEIARRGSESSVDLARRFEATVLAHRDELSHRDPDTAVDLIVGPLYWRLAIARTTPPDGHLARLAAATAAALAAG